MKKEELLRTKNKKLQTIEGVKSNLKAGEATIKSFEKEVAERFADEFKDESKRGY